MTDIHETAVVPSSAQLAEDVTVGPYAVLSEETSVASGTTIGPRVTFEGRVHLGPDNRVHPGAILGTPPQDESYEGDPTGVRVGSGNVIREYVSVNRATTPGDETTIGDDNMIMAYCHIAHDCVLGDGIVMANMVTLGGHVTIEDHVTMGGLTPVHQFVRIGAYSMVSGLSRINKDVLPFVRIAGNPAEVYDLNSIGLRRHEFNSETRRHLKQAFKILFRKNLNTSQALEKMEEELPPDEAVERMQAFIRGSDRGIHK